MANLDDIFGAKEPAKPEGQEVDIEIYCDVCHEAADSAIYNTAKKRVSTFCPNGHTVELELDLSWLIR